jgi:DNA-binding MarR family transcriptional regulator
LVRLDPVIHERTRLTILTLLSTTTDPGYSFSDLRDVLHLTDGNLMAHLRTLEEAELIERVKEGAGRASSTTIALSASGRKAFSSYLEQLEQLVRAARSK